MNRPLDYVHDIDHNYGWLIFPWYGGWVALMRPFSNKITKYHRGWRVRIVNRFHNCRATGVY